MTRPSTLGLVPARGGSKSIPLKNLKLLGGRPLIAWALEAIAASGVVDRTLVTTDDERIAEAARAAGADVPFLRPPELAGDDAPTAAAVEHALRWLEEHEGAQPECVLLVQPTEPFVRPEQIAATLELMLERGADSAITVVEVPRNQHPFHVRVRDGNGLLEFADAEAHYAHPRRQDDPPRWAFGNLYWFRRAAFLASGRIEVGRRVGLPVDAPTALDLNDEDDWAIAEAIAARL
jgi:N-acylneuraminate cytidylyltransferase/CMP-N,N'-diacetyllegionaminic acid synthase